MKTISPVDTIIAVQVLETDDPTVDAALATGLTLSAYLSLTPSGDPLTPTVQAVEKGSPHQGTYLVSFAQAQLTSLLTLNLRTVYLYLAGGGYAGNIAYRVLAKPVLSS